MRRGSATIFNFVVVGGALLIGACAAMLWRSASLAAEESAQRSLLEEAATLLDAYHRDYGHYPNSLDELAFTFSDGGDRSTLDSLNYNSDGNFYIVRTIGAYTGEERRVCR